MSAEPMPTWRDRWEKAQEWETQWWGECVLTFGEEQKQVTYADRMGLPLEQTEEGLWPVIPLGGTSVIDIGGGPVSLLLKTLTTGRKVVVDPAPFPKWVKKRYTAANVELWRLPGEELPFEHRFDEAWLYNVLQHTLDPVAVAQRAMAVAKRVRVFEWVGTDTNLGHLHAFDRAELEELFAGQGAVEALNGENRLYGTAWYGAFER